MRFQKINENSVRCIITQEELDARGVVVEELIANKEKASQFLKYVLKEADYAVGFHTEGAILNVQISIMPNGAVSMMISDDEDVLLKNVLSEMKSRLKAFKDLMNTKGTIDKADAEKLQLPMGQAFIDDGTGTDTDIVSTPATTSVDDKENNKDKDQLIRMAFWLKLDNIDNCVGVSHTLSDVPEIPSTLYKFNDDFFIEMQLMLTRSELLDFICKTTEFGSQIFPSNGESSREIKEHGTVIIKDTAISDLNQI
jgi:adapter protein MecA 1/2